MEAAGFELRCLDVRDRAGEILQLNHGHNTPYKDHSPGTQLVLRIRQTAPRSVRSIIIKAIIARHGSSSVIS